MFLDKTLPKQLGFKMFQTKSASGGYWNAMLCSADTIWGLGYDIGIFIAILPMPVKQSSSWQVSIPSPQAPVNSAALSPPELMCWFLPTTMTMFQGIFAPHTFRASSLEYEPVRYGSFPEDDNKWGCSCKPLPICTKNWSLLRHPHKIRDHPSL